MEKRDGDRVDAAWQLGCRLHEFRSTGLRTLVLAQRKLDEEFWKRWEQRKDELYKNGIADVNADVLKRQRLFKELDKLMDELESDLQVLGATAVEDRIQDGVEKTISALRQVGIKF